MANNLNIKNIYLFEYPYELGVVVPEYNDCGRCPVEGLKLLDEKRHSEVNE